MNATAMTPAQAARDGYGTKSARSLQADGRRLLRYRMRVSPTSTAALLIAGTGPHLPSARAAMVAIAPAWPFQSMIFV